MLIIADKKAPDQAKAKLAEYGNVIELETAGITYDAISGHTDIFFHRNGNNLIVAPNLPAEYIEKIRESGLEVILGEQDVGEKYPYSSAYNAVSTENLLIHNFRNTDASITRLLEDADLIHVDQGYTRCNLLSLSDEHFISSDAGIVRTLGRFDKDCLYVDPEGILLEGFKHGFIGGCCGIHQNKVFILGSLAHLNEGAMMKQYLHDHGFEVIELYDGPLFDGGSILFIEPI